MVKWHAYLDFLLTKGHTINNKHSCCLVGFGVACIFGFQYALVLGAKRSVVSNVDRSCQSSPTWCADASDEPEVGCLHLEVDYDSRCSENGLRKHSSMERCVDHPTTRPSGPKLKMFQLLLLWQPSQSPQMMPQVVERWCTKFVRQELRMKKVNYVLKEERRDAFALSEGRVFFGPTINPL